MRGGHSAYHDTPPYQENLPDHTSTYNRGFFFGPGLFLGFTIVSAPDALLAPGLGPGMAFGAGGSVGGTGVDAVSDALSTDDAAAAEGIAMGEGEEALFDFVSAGGSEVGVVVGKRPSCVEESRSMTTLLCFDDLVDRPATDDGPAAFVSEGDIIFLKGSNRPVT